MFDKNRALRHIALVLLAGVVGLGSVAARAAEEGKQRQQGNAASGREPRRSSAGSSDAGRIIDYDPAPLPASAASAARPRIWFTAKDLPQLRQRCRSTHKGYFDALAEREVKTPASHGFRAFNLAFLYQISGEAQYARQAIALARSVKPFGWVHPNEKSLPYGEWYAGLADPLACVFDWCFDQLSAEERKTVGGVLREELLHGPYLTRFHECWWMPAWLSEILALSGAGIDDKLAEKALLDYNRSIHQFVALADEIHADGAMGDYLYQYRNMMFWPEMWRRATGEDLFAKSGFYRNMPEYLLYSVLPAGRWLSNDGDGPQDTLGGLGFSFMPNQTTFAFYGWRNDNPYARWFAAHMQGWPHAGWEGPWQAILWADDRTGQKPLSDSPPVKLFDRNGVAILRSGWNLSEKSTDTVAAFYCRPAEAHTHLDVGHFTIWRGTDQLAGRGGYYWGTQNAYHHNFFTRTPAHNCVLIYDRDEQMPVYSNLDAVNDGGQVRGDPSHYPASYKLLMGNNPYCYRGEIRNFADEPGFTYLFADLTPAYAESKARHVARALLWLKPSTFVICDWVTATKAEFPKRWLLQTATKPAIDGTEKIVAGTAEAGILESTDSHRATVERGRSKLYLQTLLPERPLLRRIGGQDYGYYNGGKNWDIPEQDQQRMAQRKSKEEAEAALASMRHWRIEIEPTEPVADTLFLNVLDIGPADGPAPSAATLVRRDGSVGTAVKCGASTAEVLFQPDGRASIDGKIIGRALEPLRPNSIPPRLPLSGQ